MKKAYQKECLLTLFAFLLAALLTHVYPLYFLFPGLTRMEMFGFPAHYFLTLFIGWIVLMPLYYFYMNLSEKIDAEIAASSSPALAAAKTQRGGEKKCA